MSSRLPRADSATFASLNSRAVAAIDARRESRAVEFKESGSWESYKFEITRTAMAMCNNRDGGQIIIGLTERKNAEPLQGILDSDLKTYEQEAVEQHINLYASAPVPTQLVILTHHSSGKDFLVIEVQPFSRTPIVCRRPTPDGVKGKSQMRAGDFFVRSYDGGRPCTKRVTSSEEMNELLQVAAENRALELMAFSERARAVDELTADRSEAAYESELREDS